MNIFDRTRLHLEREARQRAIDLGGAWMRPEQLADCIALHVRFVDQWLIEATIYHSRASSMLCEWICWRFGHEFEPALIKEITERGHWKREIADEAEKLGYPMAKPSDKAYEARRSVSWASEQKVAV